MTKKNTKRTRITRSAVRALIPLDTEKIRKSELNKFKRSKKTCAALKAEAEQFEKKEYPAFLKWIHSQCGSQFTEMKALNGKIFALRNTLCLAEELFYFFPDRTAKECADAAAHYIETSGEIPEGFELFFDEAPAPEEDRDPFDSFDEEDPDAEQARKFFDSLMDDFDDDPSDFPNPFSSRAEAKRMQKTEKCIKKIYRKIIRKLHPDRAGSSTPEQQELWHAAKEAYETHDLETLQHIDAHCDLLSDKLIRFASVSSIRSGLDFYKRTNTQIRRTLRQMKQQPEWGFLSWSDKKKKDVLSMYTGGLNDDLIKLARNHASMQRSLDRLRRAPKAQGRTTARNQEHFEFF